MTTDVAERTEVEPTTDITPDPGTTEAAPDATIPTPAPETPEETPIPEEVTNFLKEQGYSPEPSEAGEGEEPKGEAKPDIPAEELKAEGAKEERERLVRQGRIEGTRQAFRNTANRLIAQARDLGLDDTAIQPLVTLLAEFNGQAGGYYAQNFIDGLYQSISQTLPESDRQAFMDSRDKHASYNDVLGDYKKAIEGGARKGWVSEKDAKSREAQAVADFVKKATKAGLFSGSKNISADTNVVVPRGGLTLAQIDAMPTSQWLSIPKTERDRLLEQAHKNGR